MAIDQDDILDAQDAYKVFKLAEPSWAAYCADEDLEAQNMEALVDFGKENFTGGLRAFGLLGAWQLAFSECRRQGLIEADESHPKHPDKVAAALAAARAQSDADAFRIRVQGMSSAQMKEAAKTEPGFTERYAALAKGEKVRFY